MTRVAGHRVELGALRCPPLSCRTSPPLGGRPAAPLLALVLQRRRLANLSRLADLPTCEADVRQGRGGQRRAPAFRTLLTASLLACLLATPAYAACPIELAVYADRDGIAEIDFSPTQGGATVTNTFKMILPSDVVLDGFVQWTEVVSRGYGTLQHKCPTGDVTGEEYAACTVWQGVIYSADEAGAIGLVPPEGQPAPKRLILADLGPAMSVSTPGQQGVFPKIPWDVFEMKGCQE